MVLVSREDAVLGVLYEVDEAVSKGYRASCLSE
jgi:hypothetical protein